MQAFEILDKRSFENAYLMSIELKLLGKILNRNPRLSCLGGRCLQGLLDLKNWATQVREERTFKAAVKTMKLERRVILLKTHTHGAKHASSHLSLLIKKRFYRFHN